MKIKLAQSAGFCFGVKRAIEIALKTASLEKNIYMLGDIVHNDEVVKQIQKSGIRKIKQLRRKNNATLIIQAHGIPQATIKKAKKMGYKIIDATCPMVKEIHRIAQEMEKKCCRIIVIGDKKHDEVSGIIGHLKGRAMVIDGSDNLMPDTIKKIKKACVVVQSTQNYEKVMKIVAELKKYIRELHFFNTICKPTRIRQEEIKKMPLENDVMIIIGSKNSANTKRLYEISKSLNARSYWVSIKEEISKDWFRGAKNVGVTAGASTPDFTTRRIIAFIQETT